MKLWKWLAKWSHALAKKAPKSFKLTTASTKNL